MSITMASELRRLEQWQQNKDLYRKQQKIKYEIDDKRQYLKDQFNIEGQIKRCVITYKNTDYVTTRTMLLSEDVTKALGELSLEKFEGQELINKLFELGAVPQDMKSISVSDEGLLHGPQVLYHKNGALAAEGSCDQGHRYGVWKFFYGQEKLAGQGSYDQGKEQGKWKTYHENGALQAEGFCDQGHRHGAWKFFHSNEALEAQGVFDQGHQCGVWRFFDDNGEFTHSSSFDPPDGDDNFKFEIEIF